jgi:hypothetical protein
MRTKQDKVLAAVAGGAILIIGLGLSFFGGVQYGKSSKSNTGNQMMGGQQGQNGFGGRQRGGQRPELGTVKTVDDKTFTMDLNGATKTVKITDSTKFLGGSATSVSVGDKVIVFGSAGSDGVITATRIAVNPSFGDQQDSSSSSASGSSGTDSGDIQTQ